MAVYRARLLWRKETTLQDLGFGFFSQRPQVGEQIHYVNPARDLPASRWRVVDVLHRAIKAEALERLSKFGEQPEDMTEYFVEPVVL
jgi:hypothetical protein